MNTLTSTPGAGADGRLATTSIAAALLLTVLCTITAFTGTSQQWFEWLRAPDVYAAALLAHAGSLRLILGIDDVFIAAYVASTVLFAMHLGAGPLPHGGRGATFGPLHALVIVAGVAAGVLDLEENHHILAMLALAENDLPIPVAELLHRSVASQLKWMFGHVAFAMVSLLVPGRDLVARVFRVTLVAVQLPLGAAVWVVAAPTYAGALLWLRYLSLFVGFVVVAWLARAPRAESPQPPLADDGAAGSDAPA